MDYEQLLQHFAALVATACTADDAGVKVEVTAGDLRLSAVRVPGGAARVPEVEANILQALREADKPLTGERLAEAAGYSFGGRFRGALAELVRRGLVVNNRPGYSLAEPKS